MKLLVLLQEVESDYDAPKDKEKKGLSFASIYFIRVVQFPAPPTHLKMSLWFVCIITLVATYFITLVATYFSRVEVKEKLNYNMEPYRDHLRSSDTL